MRIFWFAVYLSTGMLYKFYWCLIFVVAQHQFKSCFNPKVRLAPTYAIPYEIKLPQWSILPIILAIVKNQDNVYSMYIIETVVYVNIM